MIKVFAGIVENFLVIAQNVEFENFMIAILGFEKMGIGVLGKISVEVGLVFLWSVTGVESLEVRESRNVNAYV